MPNLPQNLLFLIPFFVAILAIILYFKEYLQRTKNEKEQKTIALQTRMKSIELLNAAQRVETDVLAEGRVATQKMVEEFKDKLDDLLSTSHNDITSAQSQLISFMKDLQQRSIEFEEASKAATEKRINQTFEGLESKLSDFLIKTETQTTSSIELELKAARQLIETYKQQQLKLIDENVVSMMEQTINIVLGKKLSLKDQLDLIYEALEKAKVEKFIV